MKAGAPRRPPVRRGRGVGARAAECEGAVEQPGGLLPRQPAVGDPGRPFAPRRGPVALAEGRGGVPVPGQVGGVGVTRALVRLDRLGYDSVDFGQLGGMERGLNRVRTSAWTNRSSPDRPVGSTSPAAIASSTASRTRSPGGPWPRALV